MRGPQRGQKNAAGNQSADAQTVEPAPARGKPPLKTTVEKEDGFIVVGKKGKPAKTKSAAKKTKEPRPKSRLDAHS